MIDGYVNSRLLAFIDLQVARCRLHVVSGQWSVVRCRLHVEGCLLLVVHCRLPVAGCLLEKLKTTLWFRQLATCYLQPAAYYWLMPGLNRELQRATDHGLLTASDLLPATCNPLPATCNLLHATSLGLNLGNSPIIASMPSPTPALHHSAYRLPAGASAVFRTRREGS